jgi:hypothetical protein
MLLNNSGNYIIIGGPRDGERIVLQPGKHSLDVPILLHPGIRAKLEPDERVQTSMFRYVTKPVRVGASWVDVLVPDFWNDQELLTALIGQYTPNPNS